MSKFNFVKKIDKNMALVGIAVIAIIITGVLIFAKSNGKFSFSNFSLFGSSPTQIGQKAVDYINNNKLSSSKVTLKSASEVSGLIKISIDVGGQAYNSYVTKDGRFLFPNTPIDMKPAKTATSASASSSTTQTAAKDASSVTKAAKPMLEAFVVSSCPFGLQMQRAIADAVKNIPSLASSVVIRYIGSISNGVISSMHGPEEAAENLRQICIREEQPTKYYNYISCYMQKTTATAASGMPLGDSPSCQASTGIDTAKLASCVSDPSRGLAYAQKDFDLGIKYNVSGSPTLILNGAPIDETGFGGRSSDGVKSMVCAGSNSPASFCSTKLNTTEAATSFSATYADASGSASSAANCNTGK